MASFLDKLSVKTTNAARIAQQKAANMKDTTSLSSQIHKEKNNIQKLIQNLGNQYFSTHREDPEAEFSEIIAQVIAAQTHIQELNAQIEVIKSREPELRELPPEAPQETATPSAMVCLKCGSSHPSTAKFCDACGQILIPQFGGDGTAEALQEEEEVSTSQTSTSGTESVAMDSSIMLSEESTAKTYELETEENVLEVAQNPNLCSECGAPTKPSDSFCTGCGSHLKRS